MLLKLEHCIIKATGVRSQRIAINPRHLALLEEMEFTVDGKPQVGTKIVMASGARYCVLYPPFEDLASSVGLASNSSPTATKRGGK